MSSLISRFADWATKNRSRMPAWVGRLMESAARNPDGFFGRFTARMLGSGGDIEGSVAAVPNTSIRVYIAPTNYAGQGYLWARALEHADARIGAQNSAVQLPGGFAFPADKLVPISMANASGEWAQAEWSAVQQFTHVLIEAERSLFGKQFSRNVVTEVRALEAAGVSVAFLCHGTDIRDPDRHMALTPWSPYPEDPRTEILRDDARRNLKLLEALRRPVFVSTPDLLLDVPWAEWCPVVVDTRRFATTTPVFERPAPRVIHASSNAIQKGSDRIAPALTPLIASGKLSYDLIGNTSSTKMPDVFAAADIVLDQFRLGSYGVAACEAMAAGRVVIGHVLPQVRALVEEHSGISLPIVEATPDTLQDVLLDILEDPARAKELAKAGTEFVGKVHSGDMSARVLMEQWIEQ